MNPGSWVTVFASADPELYKPDGSTQKLPQITKMLLPKVQVIGVGDKSVSQRTTTNQDGKQTTEQIPRTILTLAVDQNQAERVIYAARNGDLAFALRADKSKVIPAPGVTASDVEHIVFVGGPSQY